MLKDTRNFQESWNFLTAVHFLELSKARQRIWASHAYLYYLYTSSQLLRPGTEAAARLEFPDFSNLVASQESLISQLPSEVGIFSTWLLLWLFCDRQYHSQCKAGANSLVLSSAAPCLLLGVPSRVSLFAALVHLCSLCNTADGQVSISCPPVDLLGFCFPSGTLQKQIVNSLEQKVAKL